MKKRNPSLSKAKIEKIIRAYINQGLMVQLTWNNDGSIHFTPLEKGSINQIGIKIHDKPLF